MKVVVVGGIQAIASCNKLFVAKWQFELYMEIYCEYTEMVGNLLRVFEKATGKYLDQISSDDDEIAVEFMEQDTDSKQSKKKKTIPLLVLKENLCWLPKLIRNVRGLFQKSR
ncbi:hypothetical protein NQ317_009622 [Molorchus minor]|uniref:Uncharacterized protein n=1 Tax=Molorchus minor TaxID=1323400 RepID=A0ABQ9JK71_9CUCU|nr:hypothetical protein NQ317_009622 [Molorchus minor]